MTLATRLSRQGKVETCTQEPKTCMCNGSYGQLKKKSQIFALQNKNLKKKKKEEKEEEKKGYMKTPLMSYSKVAQFLTNNSSYL